LPSLILVFPFLHWLELIAGKTFRKFVEISFINRIDFCSEMVEIKRTSQIFQVLYRNGLNNIHVPIILGGKWFSEVNMILIKLFLRFEYTCASKLVLASFVVFKRRFFKSCGHIAVSVVETRELILDFFYWVLMVDVGTGERCRILYYLNIFVKN
jgi:hypothetical protein